MILKGSKRNLDRTGGYSIPGGSIAKFQSIEVGVFFLSFFWSGLQGPKAYLLWGGVVPSQSIGYEYL